MTWMFKLLVACVLVGVGGCSTLNDHHYEKTQRARAREAWRQHGSQCHNQVCEKDYAAGWKDGFYDIATGGKGCPPIVAPCKYWDPAQILVNHDSRRLAYYNGFQDGVACSLQYPQTHYLKLWSSCECPLPTCENQCAPCRPLLPEPCGVVFEGSEFLIEDDQHHAEPIRPIGAVPHVEPAQSPQLTEPEIVLPPAGDNDQKAEPVGSGTSVRYSEPLQFDDYGLATPGTGSVGYSIKP